MDPEAELQAREANPASSTQRVSGELRISVWIITFMAVAKASKKVPNCVSCTTKILQNFRLIASK